jgi:hypothetical protein
MAGPLLTLTDVPSEYPLFELFVDPPFTASVRAYPVGLACAGSCSTRIVPGTGLTLSVTPNHDWTFLRWEGDPDCADGAVTLNDAMVCVAQLERRTRFLVLASEPNFAGTVRGDPVGLECADHCYMVTEPGAQVTLTATPGDDFAFVQWGANADCEDGEVVMDANRTCVAYFAALDRRVEVHLLSRARHVRVGKVFGMVLVVRNLGREPVDVTPPTGLTTLDGAGVELHAGPAVKPARLGAHAVRRFSYRYRATTPGDLRFTTRVDTAAGVSDMGTSRVVRVR